MDKSPYSADDSTEDSLLTDQYLSQTLTGIAERLAHDGVALVETQEPFDDFTILLFSLYILQTLTVKTVSIVEIDAESQDPETPVVYEFRWETKE